MTRPLALLALAGCVHRAPPPDLSAGRVEIYWQGHQPLPGILNDIDVIKAKGRELCAPADRAKYDAAWCAGIYFMDDGFDCGGRKVHGCQPTYACMFQVGWRPAVSLTTLVDELGHFEWMQCKGLDQTGEDAEGRYSPAFSTWVDETRDAVRALEEK